MGGRRYWEDGRDVYDIIMGLLDYPKTDAHGSFTLSLVTDFEDGGGGATSFRFVGTEGVIDVSFTELTLNRKGIEIASADQVLKGYNSVKTFSKRPAEGVCRKVSGRAPQVIGEARVEAQSRNTSCRKVTTSGLTTSSTSSNRCAKAKPVYEDATFGYRAAAPALLCNESYRQKREIDWDPVAMKIV